MLRIIASEAAALVAVALFAAMLLAWSAIIQTM